MTEEAEIQRIPIDTAGKQLLLMKGIPVEDWPKFAEHFYKWLDAEGEPVLVIGVYGDVEWELIKVDGEEEPA